MPLILKSTHDAAMKRAAEDYINAITSISQNAENDRDVNQRALEAERSITTSLRAEIEAMKPDFELGRHTRSIRKAQDERRKAERAAKRAGI